MLLDGMLVPAEALLNGRSVTRVSAVERVDYVHIELNQHEAILAEGAPSETFVDDESRRLFDNASEYAVLYPDQDRANAPQWCAPRVTEGYALERLRRRHALLCGGSLRALPQTAPEAQIAPEVRTAPEDSHQSDIWDTCSYEHAMSAWLACSAVPGYAHQG
jgi:hypothetical protein